MTTGLLAAVSFISSFAAPIVVKDVALPTSVSENKDDSRFYELVQEEHEDVLRNANGNCRVWTSLYKHSYTEKSDLYLLSVNAMFCPGHDERENKNKQENGSDYNNSYLTGGYVHLAAYQWKNKEYGGEIQYKAISPLSSSFSTTFSSSYGKTVTDSFRSGSQVSVSDIGLLSWKGSIESMTALGFAETSTLSTTSQDPALSASVNSNYDTKETEAQWRFEFANPGVAGSVTYWLKVNLVFEMSNSYSTRNRDTFREYCRFSMTTQRRGFLGIWKKETASGSTAYSFFADLYD